MSNTNGEKCHYAHMQGFATMIKEDPERQRQIASEGGKAAHRVGTAHEWDQREAREAGRKGGTIAAQRRRERIAAAAAAAAETVPPAGLDS